MFVSEKLIFLELQKTGGTHIRRMLEQYTDGSVQRKHDRVTTDLPDKFVFGSVRNPWDWYVSLWAYGVGGKGALRIRTTRGVNFRYYNYFLPITMGKRWLTPREYLTCLYHDIGKPVALWEDAYRDADDASRFRTWLTMLLDHEHRFDMGEGYGFSPVSEHAGLMTYRYLRLFTSGKGLYRDRRLASLDGLKSFDDEYNLCAGMVCNESLEQDLVDVMQASGYQLDEQQRSSILNKESGKTNYSKRKPASYYYDADTIRLVTARERFIIDKYNYQPPEE